MDLKPKGVCVQVLHPGFVATDMTAGFGGGIAPEECAAALVGTMAAAKLEDTGKYLSRLGKEELW